MVGHFVCGLYLCNWKLFVSKPENQRFNLQLKKTWESMCGTGGVISKVSDLKQIARGQRTRHIKHWGRVWGVPSQKVSERFYVENFF